jgi:hypothetical protein
MMAVMPAQENDLPSVGYRELPFNTACFRLHLGQQDQAHYGLLPKSNRRVRGPGLQRRIIRLCCRPGAPTGRSYV